MDQRSFCLSKSRRNADTWEIADNYSSRWNLPMSQTIFRIIKEYDQLKQWEVIKQQLKA